MVELRWVWHDLLSGNPPMGAIPLVEGIETRFQKLQFRYEMGQRLVTDRDCQYMQTIKSEWKDVPHRG